MRIIYIVFLALLSNLCFSQKNASVSFEKWISLKNVNSPVISPDGKTLIYTVSSTDWTNNSYDNEIWMSREGGEPFQLTRTTKGGSSAAQFSPDGRFVSFLADRGDKNQLYIILVNGGEALPISKIEDGIGSYRWSQDGTQIV